MLLLPKDLRGVASIALLCYLAQQMLCKAKGQRPQLKNQRAYLKPKDKKLGNLSKVCYVSNISK